MGKRLTAASALLAFVTFSAVPASSGQTGGFELPAQASEVANDVFYLATAVHDGLVVDGYAVAHHHDEPTRANARPPWAGGGGDDGGGETVEDCYSFIANGARWVNPEAYEVDATALPGLDTEASASFNAWESAAGGIEIVLSQTQTGLPLVADTASPDGRNEIYAASVPDAGVLGYTIVWSTRKRGRTPAQIVEADMVIDTDWNWGTGFDAFDLGTVVAHEAGHWVGMGHTETTTTCEDQLMYPSVGYNVVKTLGAGDIAGINALY